MALVWADSDGFLVTLTGGPTSYSSTILTIPAGLSNTRRVTVSVAIDAIPNTGLGPIGGLITLEVRDSTTALLNSTFISANGGAVVGFSSTDALASGGGTIRISGTFTSATQVFAGRVGAVIDDTVISSEFAFPYASGNNNAAGEATGSFLTTEFDGSGTFWLLKVLYGMAAQIGTVETLTVPHSLVAARPSGFFPEFSGTGWTAYEGDFFDPYTSTASSSSPAPHTLTFELVTIVSAGVMPANPSFIRTVWSVFPSGATPAFYNVSLEALNSGGTSLGTIDTRIMFSTTESFNLGGVLPAGTASIRAQLVTDSGSVPNDMEFDWTYYVYCNSMTSPHYYATSLYTYSGSLNGTINYDAIYLSTTTGVDPHGLTSGYWATEGIAQQSSSPAGGSRNRVYIIA